MMRFDIRCTIILLSCMLVIGLAGCKEDEYDLSENIEDVLKEETYEKGDERTTVDCEDLRSLYNYGNEVKTMYVTVGKLNDGHENVATWNKLNTTELSWFKGADIEQYKCNAVVQLGNEDGPMLGQYGYGAISYNATIKLSGMKSSKNPQKNYRINLNTGEGSIDGMKNLVLTKSFSDPLRFTNKLCYSLMVDVPHMMSTRAAFVHLYIKDITGNVNGKFVDYGLYTMIEPINKRYFKNRSLNNSGELYQAVKLDWKRHEDVIMQPTDKSFDLNEFEKIVDSKGSNDYSNLIEVLDEVNNPSIPIEEIIDKHFDENNLYTWMAFNILVDNKSTGTQNYYLYNPMGTERFYFISWDMDRALRRDYKRIDNEDYDEGWKKGAYIFADGLLFRRIFEDEKCVNKLSEKVQMLHDDVLSGANVTSRAREMAASIKDYAYALPDVSYARARKSDYDSLVEALSAQMDENYYSYYDSIESPQPFGIYDPVFKDGKVIISWEDTSTLGMDTTYELELSDSWNFVSPTVHEKGLTVNEYDVGALPEGQYFVRVTAVAANENRQLARQVYNTEKKTTENGVLCFYVLKDGTLEVSVFKD